MTPQPQTPMRDAIFRCSCGHTTTHGRDGGYCPDCGSRFMWIGQEWRLIAGSWMAYYHATSGAPIV